MSDGSIKACDKRVRDSLFPKRAWPTLKIPSIPMNSSDWLSLWLGQRPQSIWEHPFLGRYNVKIVIVWYMLNSFLRRKGIFIKIFENWNELEIFLCFQNIM